MAIGINTVYQIPATITMTTNAVLASTGLTSPIAAGQTQHLRFWVPFSVGATGGVRALVAVPAAATVQVTTIKLFNTVAPSLTTAAQNTVFTNAAANAGTHWLEIEVYITNGVNAGTVDLQMAQNTSDANTLAIFRGGFVAVNRL